MRDTGKEADWEKEKLTNEWQATVSTEQFNVVRRVYQQERLNKDAEYQYPHHPWSRRVKVLVRSCGFGECLGNAVPIIKWLPKYNFKKHFVHDFIAGATTAVMHIPQGLAYSLLANAPPVTGLYMAFFPMLVYVLLGTSPHVSLGTFAVGMLMCGKCVQQYAIGTEENPAQYTAVEVITVLSFMVGIFQLLMWCLRMGAVSTLLSEPLVSGFTTGASLQVLASQLKDLFGIKIPALPTNYKVINNVIEVSKRLPSLNWVAVAISFITCLLLALNNEHLKPWMSKRVPIPLPTELLLVVSGTLISKYAMLHENYNMTLIGHIPTGLPLPQVPPLDLMGYLVVDAFMLTMVTYSITLSMGLIFAVKEKYEIDANQELLAMGASNLFGAFFSCAPFCASLSRSYIQYSAGCKTLITSLVSALFVLVVVLWIGPFFEKLPRCVLASIIVVSLKGLYMQILDLKKFWKLSKLDAIVWLISFLVTALINIDVGLFAGLIASLGALFIRSQTPYTCILGRVMDTDIYLDIKRYRAAHEIPGVKIYHYCGGLNFASKNIFRTKLYRKIGLLRSTTDVVPDDANSVITKDDGYNRSESYEWDHSASNKLQCVIVDATAMSYVDAPGIKALVGVEEELANQNITLLLAGPSAPVQEMIERFNTLEKERLNLLTFPTVHDAVMYYKATSAKKNGTDITVTVPQS
ncbi:unnamed protein product [Arctia plantaginis]|uniref:STAS domain-containing protein n=1 Tax=Arctia plantaginis TaxID=874455 RepID=A0A8S0YMI5_ARCPL|nr:unnamed protein product [Arctia plantaginis]